MPRFELIGLRSHQPYFATLTLSCLVERRFTSEMPYVEVHMIEGRTEQQREKIAKVFTDTLVEVLGVSRDDVWIEFVDMPKTHFATAGILRSKK